MNITEEKLKTFTIEKNCIRLEIELKQKRNYSTKTVKRHLVIHVKGNFSITTKPISIHSFWLIRMHNDINTIFEMLKFKNAIKDEDKKAFTLLYNLTK